MATVIPQPEAVLALMMITTVTMVTRAALHANHLGMAQIV
jgi:hypothetical protein